MLLRDTNLDAFLFDAKKDIHVLLLCDFLLIRYLEEILISEYSKDTMSTFRVGAPTACKAQPLSNGASLARSIEGEQNPTILYG